MASIVSRVVAAARVRGPSFSGICSHLPRLPLQQKEVNRFVAIRSLSTANAEQPLRRRRKRGGSLLPPDEGSTSNRATQRFSPGDHSAERTADEVMGFAPKDSDGNDLTADEYLALASLSPWVPCPDTVVRRALEIAEASSEDIHADLGCGDGRLNFAAVADPFEVKESWGVDVDENILERCRERVGRRFVPTGFGSGGVREKRVGLASEAERLEFVQADLLQVIEGQRKKYQQKQQSEDEAPKEDEITQRLSKSTVVTMYFVNDALKQLKPYLESILGGKPNVRVITVGYEMKGWEASWAERVLGLTVFRYDMKDVANDPVEWRVEEDGAEGKTAGATGNEEQSKASLEAFDFDGDYSDVDESSELAQYLRDKRNQDLHELNDGLEIEHDEKLDDFAQFRSKRKAQEAHAILDDGDPEEWDNDWDETEEPQELMTAERRVKAEMMGSGRGKGMRAGLDAGEPRGTKAKSVEKARPAWKKP